METDSIVKGLSFLECFGRSGKNLLGTFKNSFIQAFAVKKYFTDCFIIKYY